MVNEDEPIVVKDTDVAKDRMDSSNSSHADLDHERTREYFSSWCYCYFYIHGIKNRHIQNRHIQNRHILNRQTHTKL